MIFLSASLLLLSDVSNSRQTHSTNCFSQIIPTDLQSEIIFDGSKADSALRRLK